VEFVSFRFPTIKSIQCDKFSTSPMPWSQIPEVSRGGGGGAIEMTKFSILHGEEQISIHDSMEVVDPQKPYDIWNKTLCHLLFTR
jgi:hypothetical protein